ncbi:MAG: transcription antitermination factor NusB [Hellea sp.]|nr:transcription antitermination factor NusB [Hellea sp.]
MNDNHHKRRSRARLAAVQALYQMDIGGAPIDSVIEEFQDFRTSPDQVDEDFFAEIIRGVVQFQDQIDNDIAEHLSKKWTLRRLDMTLRAIMRAACFEILRRPDIPALVIIDEYVSIASDFFEQSEPAFVNGALDKFAKKVRAAEFGLIS